MCKFIIFFITKCIIENYYPLKFSSIIFLNKSLQPNV